MGKDNQVARTTSSAVQGVLLRDYDTANSPSLTPFIDSASTIVDRVAACAAVKGKTLSTTELELIERWLAAHSYAMSDQTLSSKVTVDAEAIFHGRTGMYLEATKYGQMALSLDYSGCLNAIGQRKTAGGFWLGRPPSAQTDYDQRD